MLLLLWCIKCFWMLYTETGMENTLGANFCDPVSLILATLDPVCQFFGNSGPSFTVLDNYSDFCRRHEMQKPRDPAFDFVEAFTLPLPLRLQLSDFWFQFPNTKNSVGFQFPNIANSVVLKEEGKIGTDRSSSGKLLLP